MDHDDDRPDAPIDPETTEIVDRALFKKPPITDVNVSSFMKLDELGKQSLPAEAARQIKQQASKAMLVGICQEERKRCFMAFAALIAQQEGKITPEKVLQFMNKFEYGLMQSSFGQRMRSFLGLLNPGEKYMPDAELEGPPAIQQLAADPSPGPCKGCDDKHKEKA